MKRYSLGRTKDGREHHCYVLKSKNLECHVTDYGAALVRFVVFGTDIVLGFDDVSGYEADTESIGSNVGRVANRIAGGAFTLNGKEYSLEQNQGAHCLHSGSHRYSKRTWQVEEASEHRVIFSLESPGGDQGFPGALKMHVAYELIDRGQDLKDSGAPELRITYYGIPDQDTLINMTNHSYFNLDGCAEMDGATSSLEKGTIRSYTLQLFADHYTPMDETSIPTGKIATVNGTPMDFREGKSIGQDIETDNQQLRFGNGYDHNFCLREYDGTVRDAAVLYSQKSGITMTLSTDLPGIQVYTANYLKGVVGKGGEVYGPRCAVCLEPQYYPDAVHHSNFPSPVVRRGEEYRKEIRYRFRRDKV